MNCLIVYPSLGKGERIGLHVSGVQAIVMLLSLDTCTYIVLTDTPTYVYVYSELPPAEAYLRINLMIL